MRPCCCRLPSEDPTALEAIEAREDQQTATRQLQVAWSALQVLDPSRRDLVIAAYIHGESREQLAKARGVPVSTVKTWIRRALLQIEAAAGKPQQQCVPPLQSRAGNVHRIPDRIAMIPEPASAGLPALHRA